MKVLNRSNFPGAKYPTKIIQFGEGNFLRAFVDWQIDILNEKTNLNAGIVIVRPIDTDFPPSLNTQDGLYTTIIRGLNEQGEKVTQNRIIRSVNQEINLYQDYQAYLALAHNPEIEFIFSNTTEAGISYCQDDKLTDSPPSSYPAKLTQLLYERFNHFHGAKDKGLILLPCELIDYNGDMLRNLVLRYAAQWQLLPEFCLWIEQHNTFCSTLVDRIVTGYPKEEAQSLQNELGYQDAFLDTAEHFYLFVIQGPKFLASKLKLDEVDLNIRIVEDIKPYKERKVAILNGAHTAMVPIAYLAGLNDVGSTMADPQFNHFIQQTIAQEIIPVLDLPKYELVSFADAVVNRFSNPFIQHQLLSIALNSMTKYRTRILPQLLTFYNKYQSLPVRLTFALAALIVFYQGKRGREAIPLQDDSFWLDKFASLWQQYRQDQISITGLVEQVLSESSHWQCDLMSIPNLVELVASQVENILQQGIRAALNQLSSVE